MHNFIKKCINFFSMFINNVSLIILAFTDLYHQVTKEFGIQI